MKNVYSKQFDTKGFSGGAIPSKVHAKVAKVLHDWMKQEGMNPTNNDMDVYINFGAWLKAKKER